MFEVNNNDSLHVFNKSAKVAGLFDDVVQGDSVISFDQPPVVDPMKILEDSKVASLVDASDVELFDKEAELLKSAKPFSKGFGDAATPGSCVFHFVNKPGFKPKGNYSKEEAASRMCHYLDKKKYGSDSILAYESEVVAYEALTPGRTYSWGELKQLGYKRSQYTRRGLANEEFIIESAGRLYVVVSASGGEGVKVIKKDPGLYKPMPSKDQGKLAGLASFDTSVDSCYTCADWAGSVCGQCVKGRRASVEVCSSCSEWENSICKLCPRKKKADSSEELEMGKSIELEHKDTIEAIKANPEMSIEEAVILIAKDHLRELPDYYSRLKVMEGKKDKHEES